MKLPSFAGVCEAALFVLGLAVGVLIPVIVLAVALASGHVWVGVFCLAVLCVFGLRLRDRLAVPE